MQQLPKFLRIEFVVKALLTQLWDSPLSCEISAVIPWQRRTRRYRKESKDDEQGEQSEQVGDR